MPASWHILNLPTTKLSSVLVKIDKSISSGLPPNPSPATLTNTSIVPNVESNISYRFSISLIFETSHGTTKLFPPLFFINE